jgi:hypothetical protein
MEFLTEEALREARPSIPYRIFGTRYENILTEARSGVLSIFLSHSHKDRPLVEGLIAILDKLGIQIYVDWNDSDMPRVTNRETAEKIKRQIHENTLFMILATPGALASRWVPWEVGIGDQVKGQESILLVPVADPSGNFHGNEYLQLYYNLRLLEMRFSDWQRPRQRIFSPSGNDVGSLLEHIERASRRGPLFS